MNDFVLLSAASMLSRQVTTYDKDGIALPDDGAYQRRNAEMVYVFGEFLRDKGLLREGVSVSRSADYEIRFSELTDTGQKFARAALDKWMQSLDRAGPAGKVDASGLERRWSKFAKG